MSDIVIRLRMAAVEIDRINGPLLGPAADEIERLQGVVQGDGWSRQQVHCAACDRKELEIEGLKAELAETIASFPLGAVKAEREACAKEIERLKAAIDKQIETHNQSCVCPCCTTALAWTTEKDQKP